MTARRTGFFRAFLPAVVLISLCLNEGLFPRDGQGCDDTSVLAGRVVDAKTGEPIRSFHVHLRKYDPRSWGIIRETVFEGAVEHDAGAFSFPRDEASDYEMTVDATGYRIEWFSRYEFGDPPPGGYLLKLFRPGPVVSCTVRVVDDATGEPVEGALVRVLRDRGNLGMPFRFTPLWRVWVPARGFASPAIENGTDDQGLIELTYVPHPSTRSKRFRDVVVVALHPDYAEGETGLRHDDEGIAEVRLGKGVRIAGRTLDDRGRPVGGVRVIPEKYAMMSPRPVFSDSDGRFLTLPVAPGPVYLVAGSPPEERKHPEGFSPEIRALTVVESVSGIILGPSKETVSWRGTFRDVDGEPISGGRITLHRQSPTGWAAAPPMDGYTAFSDSDGRFEMNKLPPGRYLVRLFIPGLAGWFVNGYIAFEEPGTVERDLRVEGPCLRGVVVDGSTGEPLRDVRCSIMAQHHDDFQPWKCYASAYVDRSGRFNLRGLAPVVYKIDVKADDYLPVKNELVAVKGEGPIDGHTIALERGGQVGLRLTGFEVGGSEEEYPAFYLRFEGTDGRLHDFFEKSRRIDPFTIVGEGTFDRNFRLRPGHWTAVLTFPGVGFVRKPVTVARGTTEILRVAREEVVESLSRTTTLKGRLVRDDGSPAESVEVALHPRIVPGRTRDVRIRHDNERALTDGDGRFAMIGIQSGTWNVSAHLDCVGDRRDDFLELPPLVIPEDSAETLDQMFTLPSGEVRGRLVDGSTGDAPRPIEWPDFHPDRHDDDEVEAVFSTFVQLEGTTFRTTHTSGSQDCRFHMRHVPPGRYCLKTGGEGFHSFTSAPFELRSGEVLDLGTIALMPEGILVLAVKDGTGKTPSRLTDFYVNLVIPEAGIFAQSGSSGPRGFFTFNDLPTGRSRGRIETNRFGIQLVDVTLEPRTPLVVDFVIEE